MSSCMHPDNDQPINPSGNSSIRDVIEAYTGRRNFLKGTLGAAAVMTMGGFAREAAAYTTAATSPAITFGGVPANLAASFTDQITVPQGYTARVLIGWGDAIGKAGPKAHTHWDASQPMTEALQLSTFGSHNDGMHLFPFPAVGAQGLSNDRGLLVVNHEYVDPGLVHNTGTYGTDTADTSRDDWVTADGAELVEQADLLDDAGALHAQLQRQRVVVEAGALVDIDEVQADGVVADAHLARARFTHLDRVDHHFLGAAGAVDADGAAALAHV